MVQKSLKTTVVSQEARIIGLKIKESSRVMQNITKMLLKFNKMIKISLITMIHPQWSQCKMRRIIIHSLSLLERDKIT